MKKLYLSRRDKKLFGLCGGLGEYFNMDSTLIRVIVVAAAFFSFGAVLVLYLIASVLVPHESTY
ncbi:PspC domain-containing protein [Paenibacillus sp. J2TS4]|uniref:PspC domain-containing protein n=1 Tax=Paenibacillus sp. J2TS4 TaxID=2807194 RepID=UPI001B1CE97A|nr:PspC domain-containing protein [Paenibacillus sp. J2TS4]GIP33270.1 PspC domain-containing protein [Paenibacillus sp. J2TS4]